MTYREWCETHAGLFGLRDVNDLKTLASWEAIFLASGYAVTELDAASRLMARNPAVLAAYAILGKLPGHLATLHQQVREVRAASYRRELPVDKRGTCTLCGGSGRVVVPELASVHAGKWQPRKIARAGASYYTAAVWCSCALGNWFVAQTSADHRERERQRMATLGWYEQRNPNWRRQLEQRDNERLAVARLTTPRGSLDDVFDRLLAQFGRPRIFVEEESLP